MFTKTELIAEVAEKSGSSKAEVERVINALQDSVIEHVAGGDEVRLSGFVSFAPAVRAARKMRNPSTGEEMTVPEKKVVRLKVMKRFKDAVES